MARLFSYFVLCLLVVFCSTIPVFASDAKGPFSQAVASKDSFRDPFWPVGYVPIAKRPPPPQPKVEKKNVKAPSAKSAPIVKRPAAKPLPPPPPAPDWKKALGRLRITGYAETDAGLKSCVIDDKTVSEGETISVVFGKYKYNWRVDRIAPAKSQMRFTRQGAVLLKK